MSVHKMPEHSESSTVVAHASRTDDIIDLASICSENRLFIAVQIERENVAALIDPGATGTLLGPRLAHRLSAKLKPSSTLVRSANGKISRALRAVKMTFSVNDRSVTLNCEAVREIEHDMILGMDLGRALDVDLRLGRRLWRANEGPWHECSADTSTAIPSLFVECAALKVIDGEHREAVMKLVEQILAQRRTLAGKTDLIEHHIKLIDDVPIKLKLRRMSPVMWQTAKTIVEKWEKEGVIERSASDYCSAPVLVRTHRTICKMTDLDEIDGITPEHLAVCEGMRRTWQRERPVAERDLLEISLDGDVEELATAEQVDTTNHEPKRDESSANLSTDYPELEVMLQLRRPEAVENLSTNQDKPPVIDGAGKQPESPRQPENAVVGDLATLSLEAERQEEERLREEALRSSERKRHADAAEQRIAAARREPSTAGTSGSTQQNESQLDGAAVSQDELYRRQGAYPKYYKLRSSVEVEDSRHARRDAEEEQRQENWAEQSITEPPVLVDQRSPRTRSTDSVTLPREEQSRRVSLCIVEDRRWLPVVAQPSTGPQEWDLDLESTPPTVSSRPIMMAGPPPDLVNQGSLPAPELFGPSQLLSRDRARIQHHGEENNAERPLPIKYRGVQFGNLTPIPTDKFLDPPPYTCFNCRGRGHGNRNCPQPPTQYCENCGRRGCTRGTCPRCKVAYQRWLALSERQETSTSKKRTSPTPAGESPLPKRARSPTGEDARHENKTAAESQAEAANSDQLRLIAAILESTRDLSPEVREETLRRIYGLEPKGKKKSIARERRAAAKSQTE
ncbi:hypothetical protein TKK_0012229 [Trichogramma kaykai]